MSPVAGLNQAEQIPKPAGDTFVISGGGSLSGKVRLAGAKNATTKMIVASLLTDEECVLENFPAIGDAVIVKELCGLIGSTFEESPSILKIKTPEIKNTTVTSLSRRNRIPILTVGPLLARAGEAEVPLVGGDKIGARPVDIHLTALEALGAEIEVREKSYLVRAKNGLRGAVIPLRYPSIGATENIILSSVLASGRTVIQNSAIEPEIIDLIKMLQKMGAIIELGANRQIYIEGVKRLRGVRHRILPDRNEAVSFACLALATAGDVLVEGAIQDHLITFLNICRRIGGEYEVSNEGIRFWRKDELRPIVLEPDTHPGFMTDWQQPLCVILTQAQGNSVIHETVYEDRFHYTEDLNLMGARITLSKECLGELPCRFKNSEYFHSARIAGPIPLHGASIKVPDLRAGMAHVIAALIAEGESVIHGVSEIDRGYECIDGRLMNLGAKIKRV